MARSTVKKERRCAKCGNRHKIEDCNSEVVRCFHCRGSHETCHGKCIEQRYQQELTSVQAKQRLSRNRAKAMVNREPKFRTMNYAGISKTTTDSSEGDKAEAVQAGVTTAAGEPPSGEVEVLCTSPNSSSLFTNTECITGCLRAGESRRGQARLLSL